MPDRSVATAPAFPVKTVQIAGRSCRIAGVSQQDPYFADHVTDEFEAGFTRLFQRFLAEDDICLDIGANIGMKALLLSQCVPKGHVVAVEAAPTVAEVLKRNVDENRATNVSVVHCAVSDADGEIGFSDNSAWGHIVPGGVRVPARRLSSIVAEQRLTRLDFIKIDVEGHEYTILRDALETINRHRALVLFEFNAFALVALADAPPLEFARWITASFAHVWLVRPDGSLRRVAGPGGALELLHTNMVHDGCMSDILATNASERLIGRLPDVAAEASAAEAADAGTGADARARAEQRALAACGAALAEAAARAAERDAALADAAAMRASTSWKVTVPMRALKLLMVPRRQVGTTPPRPG